ncbi:MAG: 4-hydroxy-3-methylbut-2-enyl diphosphate reductase, partial [Bacteroidia bacterium]|nr:4-hydroxy-3-methylbut-2-enyl diphosphate reductase [Bacteroidia bacterium]
MDDSEGPCNYSTAMKVEVDRKSGFCFGVVKAISKAERGVEDGRPLYCLGEIVHNEAEVGRLTSRGLTTISREQFFTLKNCRVLIRAHGEPPETYEYAAANNIELLDATCPIVHRIQKKVADAWERQRPLDGQVVIFGKKNHAEVLGLNGQTGHQAIVVENT